MVRASHGVQALQLLGDDGAHDLVGALQDGVYPQVPQVPVATQQVQVAARNLQEICFPRAVNSVWVQTAADAAAAAVCRS